MVNDKRYIYGFLAKLLRPGNNRLELLSYLPANQSFWDDLVKVGSSHLVLPAIYLNFKLKRISKFLPKELYEYLKEIQVINFQRNLNFRSVNTNIKNFTAYVYSGMSIINKIILDENSKQSKNFEKDFYPKIIKKYNSIIQKNRLKI